MKQCTLCKKPKDKSEFNKKISTKDGLQNKCRECSNQNSKEHYQNNKKYYLDKNHRRRKELREWLIEYKDSLKCSCGESRIPCLEFHHTNPKEKDFCIAVAVNRGYSLERLKKEIAKCDILCANCHAIEHWNGEL